MNRIAQTVTRFSLDHDEKREANFHGSTAQTAQEMGTDRFSSDVLGTRRPPASQSDLNVAVSDHQR